MLQPGKVGIACRWHPMLPATISPQQIAAPIAVIEGRIGNHKISFQILVGIVQKRSFIVPFHLGTIDAPNRQVHLRQAPGGLVALLPINGDVVNPALMLSHKLFRLHKHPARSTAGVKHPPFVRFQHGNQQFYDATRRVELPALLAFRQGKLPQKILKHMPQHIRTASFGIAQGNITHQINQPTKTGRVEVLPRKHLGQNAP